MPIWPGGANFEFIHILIAYFGYNKIIPNKKFDNSIRYALRRRNEQPRITHDLVYHVVLPIPRPEEFVHTVYVYANGKPLGKDLAEALVKAEYCLDEIRGNMSKQLAELKEECPIPPNIETDRKEKFDAFFDVAKGLKSGLPTFLDKNGRKMDWDEVLPLVEDAFDAIVSGKKLDVFLPTIKREGRIKGMAADYANQIPKQQGLNYIRID